jgi:hypothetical protein
MNEVDIPLKITGIGAMKAELRELKGAIADATDPAAIVALSQRAGELKDRIGDANDAVNVFASGSKFEQVSNGIGGIKDSLMSLDFEEANDKAKNFAVALGKLNPADLAKSMKGLVGTVTTVGGAFVKLGVTILANPIFILVAVITVIVVAIGFFLKKIGALDAVLKAIMAPINAIVQGFKNLTDMLGLTDNAAEENSAAIKKATDENIKNIEAEYAARNALFDVTKDLSIDELAAIEASTGVAMDAYETKEDLQKQQIQDTIAENDEKIKGFELQSSLNEEEQKLYDDLVKAKKASNAQLLALDIQKINNQKKLAYDIDKQLQTLSAKQIKNEADRAKAMLEIQEKEALAKLASARREASRSGDLETVKKIDQLVILTTQDFQRQRLEITNKGNSAAAKATTSSVTNTNKEVESAQDKHLKEMRIKHKKAVDDATTAGKSKFEIAQLQIDQMIEERNEIDKLNIKTTKVFKNKLEQEAAVSAMNKDIKKAQDALEADKIKIADQDAIARINTMIALETDATKKLELQKTLIEAERVQAVANKELSKAQIDEINANAVTDTKAIADQIKAIEDDKYTKILAMAQLVAETQQSKEAFALERFKGTKEQEIAAQESFLTTTLKTLDTQRIAELAALNLSEEEKAAIKEKYRQAEIVATEAKTAKLAEIDKTARDKLNANIEAGFQLTTTAMSSIASLQDISTKKKLKGVKQGSKEEEKILKQQFEQQKKMQLAMAVINGAQAIVSILAQYPKFDGGFAMSAAIAGSVIATATSLATIASSSFEGGGTAPDAPDSNSLTGGTGSTGGMATPSVSMFGSNNNLNNVGSPGASQGGQNITVNAIVSETQVTEVQNRVNRIQRNAEL